MAESGRIRLREVRDVSRLIAGCERRWADARAWRQHLLKGMRALFDAQVAMWVEGAGVDEQGRPQHVEMATAGWPSPRARRKFMDYLAQGGPAMMPDFIHVAKRVLEHGRYTGRRVDHVPDRLWYGSEAYRGYVSHTGTDDYVVSMQQLPALGTTGSLSVHRLIDAPRFEPRHRRLLALLHAELAPRIGQPLALQRQRGMHGLTRRQRHTLDCLSDGLSEKQAADRLGVSATTVHGYVRELYRHFRVGSRGALLAYLLRRAPEPTPGELGRAMGAGDG